MKDRPPFVDRKSPPSVPIQKFPRPGSKAMTSTSAWQNCGWRSGSVHWDICVQLRPASSDRQVSRPPAMTRSGFVGSTAMPRNVQP
ncbi:MAG: hypothetical protein IPF66_14950 [Holophagales bacterium]|nr:hypothetical protein [Holophagales bacterium]